MTEKLPEIVRVVLEAPGERQSRVERTMAFRQRARWQLENRHNKIEWPSRLERRLRGKQPVKILRKTFRDEEGRVAKVAISAKKPYEGESDETDLDKAAIVISVGDENKLALPPGEEHLGTNVYPLPGTETLDLYEELINAIERSPYWPLTIEGEGEKTE